MVSGTAGNVSVRLEADDTGRGLMAVTPSGVGYDGMAADDIVVTDFDLETVAGELAPSSESLLHVGIYERRTDAAAVVHTHSAYSSAFAVAGADLPPVIDEVGGICRRRGSDFALRLSGNGDAGGQRLRRAWREQSGVHRQSRRRRRRTLARRGAGHLPAGRAGVPDIHTRPIARRPPSQSRRNSSRRRRRYTGCEIPALQFDAKARRIGYGIVDILRLGD